MRSHQPKSERWVVSVYGRKWEFRESRTLLGGFRGFRKSHTYLERSGVWNSAMGRWKAESRHLITTHRQFSGTPGNNPPGISRRSIIWNRASSAIIGIFDLLLRNRKEVEGRFPASGGRVRADLYFCAIGGYAFAYKIANRHRGRVFPL